jgi:hypothetical protein
VLQVAEASGGEYNVDVVFEKDGKRFLETFPQSLLTPVADIFQRRIRDVAQFISLYRQEGNPQGYPLKNK